MKEFNWNDYKSISTYDSSEIKDLFKSLKLCDKKIKNISLLGKIDYLDKEMMIISYNNFYRKDGERLRKKIFEEDIPLDDTIGRHLTTIEPIKIEFDDDSEFCLCFTDYGCFNYSIEKNNFIPIVNINYKKLFNPVFDKKIINIRYEYYSKEDRETRSGMTEEHLVDLEKAKLSIEKIIRSIYIDFENDLTLKINAGGISIIPKEDVDDNLVDEDLYVISYKEFKECIPFYSNMFDKHIEGENIEDIYR